MLVNKMVETISTAMNKETAQEAYDEFYKKYSEFRLIIALNNGDYVIHGIDQTTFDPGIIEQNGSEDGVPLSWFVRKNSTFKFLGASEGSLNYSPAKKINVLKNMAKSLAFSELQVFMVAMRGQLFKYDGEINPGITSQKYKGMLSILQDEKTVNVDETPTDTLLEQQEITVTDDLVEETKEKKTVTYYFHPEDSTKVWKGKGRKPNWLVALLKKKKNTLEKFAKEVEVDV